MTEDDFEALAPRPRRRLLGAGGNPIPLALLGVLLIACGFIAGVLVEKGQTTSGRLGIAVVPPVSPNGSRSAGSAISGTSRRGQGGTSSFAAPVGPAATIGQVAYIDGSTLYVTNSAGNTVKVRTSAGSTVTKTVKANVKGIRPGETVVIIGLQRSASGAIDAESCPRWPRCAVDAGQPGMSARRLDGCCDPQLVRRWRIATSVRPDFLRTRDRHR